MGQPAGDDTFAEGGNLAEAQEARCEGRLDYKIWQVRRPYQSGGQKKYLGLFDTIEKASVAYTRAAKDAFGQFARAR